MTTRQPNAVPLKIALATLALIPGHSWAQDIDAINGLPHSSGDTISRYLLAPTGQPGGVPFVQIDKPRFADGEQVFFWVGVRGDGKRTQIPQEFWSTCRLIVTRPDGTKWIEPVSWPPDGPLGSSWQGGSTLPEPVTPGRYKLVFEFAGQQSAPATLVVEHVPLIQKLHAEFVFGPTTALDTPVTLTVRNDSNETICFPRLDGSNSSIWVHFSGTDNQGSVYTFYPPDKRRDTDTSNSPEVSFADFTWDVARKVPVITLKPGETYRQALSLRAAIAEANRHGVLAVGQYTVRFGTTLQLLIGEQNGTYHALSPIRLPVETTATCSATAL